MSSGDREPQAIYTISVRSSDLIAVKSKRNVYVKIRRWALMTVGMLILIVLSALLTRFLFWQGEHPRYENCITGAVKVKDICVTSKCLQTANSLKMTMDTTVDPCENFEEFVCGKWNTAYPTKKLSSHSWFHVASDRRSIKMRDVLNNRYDDNANLLPIKNAKRLYTSCINNEYNYYYEKDKNATDVQVLRSLLQSLDLIYDEKSFTRNQTRRNFFKKLANVKRTLDMNTFFSAWVNPYILDNKYNVLIMYVQSNSYLVNIFDEGKHDREKVIQILRDKNPPGSDKVREPRKKLLNDTEDDENDKKWLQVLKETFLEVVSNGTYLSGNYKFPHESLLNDLINQMYTVMANWDEEIESRTLDDFFDDDHGKLRLMSCKALIESVDEYRLRWFEYTGRKIDDSSSIWNEFFSVLMKGIFPETRHEERIQEIPLLVYELERLLAMTILFDEVDTRVMEMYLWLNVVRHADRYTSGKIRRLFDSMKGAPTEKSFQDITLSCAESVQNFMPFAATRMYMNSEHEESSISINTSLIFNSFKYIRDAIGEMILNTSWLDDTSRIAIMTKIRGLRWMIGYPDWIAEDDQLVEYYSNITLNDTYLYNWVKLESFSLYGTLESLLYFNEKHEATWPAVSPLVVNAFYSPSHNQMTIPYGIITFPFYDHGIEAMNFGALGMIIGHEISHGFDPRGKLYDHKGDYKNTWTKKADAQYENKTSCYVKHYNEYHIPSVDLHVNGSTTLGENVADNCGLKASFHAYKQWVKDNGKEPFLPGFIEYTHEQLFYISFANMWCGRFTNEYLKYILEKDVHSPQQVRVMGVLRNSPEFSKVWKCHPNSRMNLQPKCSLW